MTSGYNRVHYLLRRDRGSAVGRACIVPGCRRLADGWGLVGEATHYGEKGGDGKPVRWSTDLNDYAPLCNSHNSQLDGGGDLLMCPSGHVRLTWGTTGKSECRGCVRERRIARRADPEYRARERAHNRAAYARKKNGEHL